VPDDITIRPATPDDADAVARLFIRSFALLTFLPTLHTDAETYDFIVRSVMPQDEVFVAEAGGTIAGFVAMAHGDFVEHLYVDPAFLRRGVGSALIRQAKTSMPNGFRLWCFQENTAARRFYESHGLVVVELTDGLGNEEKTPDALYAWTCGTDTHQM
jgi:ribosomal protein S18 acetylase RimI-like enzyme